MDLRIFVEPQHGASYEQQATLAVTAERLGFSGFFRSDHYLSFSHGAGLPGPTDTWVTLGAIARETTTIRLGTLVCSITFRLPGPLAVAVSQVDAMSGGRVELGIGAGWFDTEHTAYGIPFPAIGTRFEMLGEQLEILRGLWSTPLGDEFSFTGDHYTVLGSPALPKPTQPGGPPVIMGGFGARTTPRLAAAHAAEFNVPFAPVATFVQQRDRVRAACDAIGRDPDDLTWSTALTVCCAANDTDLATRAAATGSSLDQLRATGLAGSPAEILDRVATWAEAGADRIYLQVLDLDDLDHVELLAADVLRLLP